MFLRLALLTRLAGASRSISCDVWGRNALALSVGACVLMSSVGTLSLGGVGIGNGFDDNVGLSCVDQ